MSIRELKKFDLTGKTALITGAAGLLGPFHAKALLELNAKVVITDISNVMLESVKSELSRYFDFENIYSYQMDVCNEESVVNVKNKLKTLGLGIDILINNAALNPKVEDNSLTKNFRLENFDLEIWNREMAVGLTGAFICSKIFGTEMSNNYGGIILNIASDLSVIAPNQNLYIKHDLEEDLQPVKPATYSVIKSGIVGLTKYIATYWGNKGVRCNAISPGGVFNDQDAEFVNKLKTHIPLNRMAEKDEYMSAIQFLCSDASSYMNGHNMLMDGGRSIW